MTNTKVNSNSNLDVYLTKRFKGSRMSAFNKFLLELYDRAAWRSCYFQKKPEAFKKAPDRFYLFTNNESMSSMVAKVNSSRPFPVYSNANSSVYDLTQIVKDDMIIECIYSKPIFCNVEDDEAAIDLLERIVNE